MKPNKLALICALLTAIFLMSCEMPGLPTVQTGPDAEVSFDGLHRVDHSRAKMAWMKPDIDLKDYKKIMLLGAGIEYRAVRHKAGRRTYSQDTEFFGISDRQKEQVRATVRDAFYKELGKSKVFSLADTPGPDTLLIRGALLDVVSRRPPDKAGRGQVYLASYGEATLVIEVRDSMSTEILARAIDRRAAEPFGASGAQANVVSAKVEVSRLASHWANTLRYRLEELMGQKAE